MVVHFKPGLDLRPHFGLGLHGRLLATTAVVVESQISSFLTNLNSNHQKSSSSACCLLHQSGRRSGRE